MRSIPAIADGATSSRYARSPPGFHFAWASEYSTDAWKRPAIAVRTPVLQPVASNAPLLPMK